MSGERAGYEIGTASYPLIWEDFIECSCYSTIHNVQGIHRVDTTLFDEYSIVHFLIKFRDSCV